jgi:hypothetical protein
MDRRLDIIRGRHGVGPTCVAGAHEDMSRVQWDIGRACREFIV